MSTKNTAVGHCEQMDGDSNFSIIYKGMNSMGKSNISINEYAKSKLSNELKEWIAVIDKFMIDNGCKAESFLWGMGAGGRFPYTSRKSKKPVCIIYINPDNGCSIALGGNHFIHPNQTNVRNILDELPQNMLDDVMKGADCLGKCITHDYSINPDFKCSYGVADIFSYNGTKSLKCRHNPRFDFSLDKTTELEIFRKWIEYEVAWTPEGKKRVVKPQA